LASGSAALGPQTPADRSFAFPKEAEHVPEPGPRDPRDAALELQTLLLDAVGVESFLVEVARRAAGAVSRAQSCGITVQATATSRVLGATTDEFARRMDDVQYAVDDGPCLTCLRQGVSVPVADIRNDRRWPAFARRGTEEGAGSSLSVPMIARERTVGALNLYSRDAHALTEGDRARATQFAGFAAGAVALALQLAEHEEREHHLETALRSRSTIDQAMGVLMAQAHLTADEAFETLRQRSQHTNTKLRDVAIAVIAEAARRHE
jgi:GAF domain-containing protein